MLLAMRRTPRSMQRIAVLIIMCLGCVRGIRNEGGGADSSGYAATSTVRDYYASAANYAPPTEVIGFTLADASTPQGRPPSYLAPNYARPALQTAPTYARPQTAAAAGAYERPQQRYESTLVPLQLQTTPILSYRDPYTDEHHQYRPPAPQPPARWSNKRKYPAAELLTTSPQEYTVQSSLLVQPAVNKRRAELGAGAAYRPRPGYVFEEPLALPSYQQSAASVASLYASNYDAAQPLGPFSRPTRPPPPPLPAPAEQPHLSYDSHDYPPPTYLQQAQDQAQSHFQSPQRQDTAAPNYANNFGNYLPNAPARPPPPQQQQQRPFTVHYQPSQAAPHRPAYDNYYSYQLGELPPPGQVSARPGAPSAHRPQPSPLGGGLAGLASLLTGGTQQYAPQLTNLLFGALTGGMGGGGGIVGTGTASGGGGTRPLLNTQLIKALENIARNDDLQCVPKVLCQMIARQTERGQLPNVVTSPAITNFLAAFPASSPALIYGRAALLGISGGEASCTQSYAQCPKNEYEILYYLNNHRGGFFKFFSEPEEQPLRQEDQQEQQATTATEASGTSIFSLLSALAGGGAAAVPRPTRRPAPPATTTATPAGLDLTSGIGNFFTNVLSDYLGGGVEYQRRRRRRRSVDEGAQAEIAGEQETGVAALPDDFHDAEDGEDTQSGGASGHRDDAEGRILHKDVQALLEQPRFFPGDDEVRQEQLLRSVIEHFNAGKSSRKLKFPSGVAAERPEPTRGHTPQREQAGHVNFGADELVLPVLTPTPIPPPKYKRRGKKLIFKDAAQADDQLPQHTKTAHHKMRLGEGTRGDRVVFPDGLAMHSRRGRLLNRPGEAATTYAARDDRDGFVVSSAHRPEAGGAAGGAAYYSASSSHSTSSQYVASALAFGGANSDSANRYATGPTAPPYKAHNSLSENYASSGHRFGSRYQTTRRPAPHEDDKNVYINNGQGVTEYYLTPDGRKVYL